MAQLFITPYEKSGNSIIITNSEIIEQCKKVLRLEVWKEIFLQNTIQENTIRHTISITEIKQHIKGTITDEQIVSKDWSKRSMSIAMPNKRDKIELIVQKLAEIWIHQINFWPSERSIIKEWNAKKAERLIKIAKEATEQSRNRFMPEIWFSKSPLLSNATEYIVFDKQDWSEKEFRTQNSKPNICWIVGPEGWLTNRDYTLRAEVPHHIQQLGDGILRTETWAIIGWRLIKNT